MASNTRGGCGGGGGGGLPQVRAIHAIDYIIDELVRDIKNKNCNTHKTIIYT